MSVLRLLRRKIGGKTKSYILHTERNKMLNLSENEKNLKFSSFMYKSNKIAQSQLNLAPLHNGGTVTFINSGDNYRTNTYSFFYLFCCSFN